MSTQLRHSGSDVQELLDKIQYALDNTSTCSPALSNVTFSGEDITFSNTITADISGNAATATKATKDGNGNVINSTYLKLSGGTMTGNLTVPTVIGNVTGNCSGSSGSCTGNAATATKATKATQDGSGNVITSTYTKKAGDTMTGQLTVHTDSFPCIISKSDNASYPPGVGFQNNTQYLGSVAMSTEDGPLLRYNSASSSYSTVLDTETVKDYITAQGVVKSGDTYNTNWYYAKWNSGKIEAWAQQSIDSVSVTSQWGYIFESTSRYNLAIPSSIFGSHTPRFFVNCTASNGEGIPGMSSAGSATTTPYVYINRGGSAGGALSSVKLHWYAVYK